VGVLETIARLVPCDAMGVTLADNHGYPVEQLVLPRNIEDLSDQVDVGEGPLYVGVMHWLKCPREAEACFGGLAAVRAVDGIAVGFRNGPDHVAQIWLNRKTTRFSQRDIDMLALLNPVFRRLLRERPTPQLPANLTVQERRVLTHVAAGQSNADIAQQLFVAPSTVRKHLEHSYRKLGVTNRVAAVARLQGRDLPGLHLSERTKKFA
jgi:DNA-binding CsgD family transcriptional regulator